MKKTLLTVGVAVALMMAWSIARVQGQQDQKVTFASADHANFQESPTKGVSMAAIWGDAGKGAHGTFTKFVPGFDAGMHTHTNDISIVVVKRAYLYKADPRKHRLGPVISFPFPAEKTHRSD